MQVPLLYENLTDSIIHHLTHRRRTPAGQVHKFEFADCNCWVKGDTLIEFHHQPSLNSLHCMFSFYFHTSFIKSHCIFLQLHEIDRLKKVEGYYCCPT